MQKKNVFYINKTKLETRKKKKHVKILYIQITRIKIIKIFRIFKSNTDEHSN
jgi:hypothetical protein